MDGDGNVEVTKERHVITYAELWYTCLSLLKRGQDQEEGSFYQFMGSLVFAAFSFEAYLNHLGGKLFESWHRYEHLGPRRKLETIARQISLKIDYESRPFSIMSELFGFRTEILQRQYSSRPGSRPRSLDVDTHRAPVPVPRSSASRAPPGR